MKPGEMGAHDNRGSPDVNLSSRGSKYRGVSRNGKKWQVSLPHTCDNKYYENYSCRKGDRAKGFSYPT